MNLNIRAKYLKKLKQKGGTDIEELRWRSDEQTLNLDTKRFTENDLTLLREIAQTAKDPATGKLEPGALALTRKINTRRLQQRLSGGYYGNPPFRNIKNIATLLIAG